MSTPAETWKSLQDRVQDAVKTYFPFEGRTKKLVLHGIAFDDSGAPRNDIRTQEQAKEQKKTWGAQVIGDVSLVDKTTGKELDRTKIRLMTLPKPTNRYSYIVDGSEWQVDNLWRLRSGVYAHIKQNGELETEFNLAKSFAGKPRIKIPFDPESRKFKFEWGSFEPSLYSVLKVLGVQDEDMKKAWGEDIYKANVAKHPQAEVEKLYARITKNSRLPPVQTYDQKAAAVVAEFQKTGLLPEMTKMVFGKPIDHVNGEALLLGAKRILDVARGNVAPDDRNSLIFKTLHGTDDFLHERLVKPQMRRTLSSKINNNIDRQEKVRDVISGDLFNRPIREFFTSSMLSKNPEQVNPLEMMSNHRSTTIMADEGGIKKEQSVTPDMKLINPSHFGFLDPIHTPESERTGITLHLPIGLKKQGNTPMMTVYDLKTHQVVSVSPTELHSANVLLPDQVTWKGTKPHPIADLVKMKDPASHEMIAKPFSEARYLVVQPYQLFDEATNLIPFLQNNQGNRTMTASRQGTQAVSLHEREQPLVQTKAGGSRTWEKLTGYDWSHPSQHDGKVVEIKTSKENGHPEAIIIQSPNGKTHEVQIYNHFPLNDAKTFINSTPLVKIGDEVKAGQTLADTNFTRGGLLSLGTNLRVAYLPYKGYNFEDGIVISNSAAKKLTSEHLHRKTLEADPDRDEMSKSKFIAFASTTAKKLTKDQMSKVGTDGIIQVGQRVEPGDVLIAAVGKKEYTGETARLMGRLSKKAFNLQDRSVTWDSDHPGEVVKVVRAPNKKGATVYVKTLEPAEVGDKIVGRHGNKAIITRILADHEMPRIGGTDGEHVQVLMNPSGVPTRINLGQMLETAASKVAKKTGQPYIVNNFDGPDVDYSQKVKDDLAKHGISDQEVLFDPTTGKRLGDVLTGNQYIFKLKHQVEKKLAVRGGGAAQRGSYTVDDAPKGTGAEHPGQGIGQLEFYALLAHGARANLREMATYKSDKHMGENRDEMNHIDFWDRVRTGQPLPPPRPTFAYKKFENLLTGLGVNIQKDGNSLYLMPLTDKGVLAMSHGEIKDGGRILRGKDAKELEKGLFDPKITGGLPDDKGKGLFWSHLALAEPVPNPVFVGASKTQFGPAVLLSDLKYDDFEAIAKGKKSINGMTGGKAINEILKKIDVKAELKKTLAELPKLKKDELNKANKKAKYLMALDRLNMKPNEAYMMNYVPVLPPAFRPIIPMPDGSLRSDDINFMYKNIALLNDKLKNPIKELGGRSEQEVREQLYDAMRAYAGLGGRPVYDSQREVKGILDIIAGDTQPKQGYFQKRLMKRRQELSMRSTIIPEPAMHLDYVGLPKDAAMELYKHFVVRELGQVGFNPVTALKAIKENREIAWKALDRAMEKRPVLLKRDPALHKFSIMAFKPKVVEGKAIQIHPLVTAGYNADFDGDSVDLDTPIPLKIEGQIALKTGRELLKLLNAGDGNWVVETKGIKAYTYNGWRPIKTVSFHEVRDKKKFRVTLKNGVSFVVSEDHSVMVHHEERKPDQLTVGTELDHETIRHSSENNRDGGDYEVGVAYGNFLGDGCAEIRKQGGGRISIACLPMIEREYLMDIWRRRFEGNPSQYVYGFHVNGVALAQHFLDVCGRYCNGKYVSGELLSRSPEFLKGLLAGYILSDGSVETTKSGSFLIRTWSRSKALRDGMALVATMLGLPHSLRQREAKGEMNYIISFGKEAIKVIDYRCPGPKGDRVREACFEYKNNRNDDRSSQSERGFEIKSIEEVSYSDRMIDIEVDDESHVFAIQGGVILHNTMSAFVPLTDEAVKEAHKMFPSNNLFSSTHGGIMYEPTQESLLGLHLLSKWGKPSGKSFPSFSEAVKAKERGVIGMNDVIKVGGQDTTLGRLTINNHLPDEFKKTREDELLHDPKFVLRKGNVRGLLGDIAKKDPKSFSMTVDRLKDLGNDYSYQAGFSFGLKDLDVQKDVRDRVLKKYDDEADVVKKSKGTQRDKETKLVDIYSKATDELVKEMLPHLEKSDNKIYTMVYSGARGSVPQFRQIAMAPMLMKDGAGRTIPTPVKKSYSEGLDVGDYWTTLHGARMGTLQKVEGTSEPGALTKEIANVMMPNMIVSHDCGTTHGIHMDINEEDIQDRALARPLKLGNQTVPAGTIVTPAITAEALRHKIDKLVVRSPLKCAHGQGICAKCYGLSENGNFHEIGTNIGIIAGHAMGEPATQLAMDSFHTGGVAASRGAGAGNKFARLNELIGVPKTLKNSATLSKVEGTVDKIERDQATNGHFIYVGGERHFAPPGLGLAVKTGDRVAAGHPMTEGSINPHELLPLTDIHTVQNYITDELHRKIYSNDKGESEVNRRNIETVVRSLTNLARVEHPGDSSHLHGDVVLRTVVDEHNRQLKDGEHPIIAKPIIRSAEQVALDQQEDWMARLNFRRLKQSILEGAAKNWKSDLHGSNPVPAYAFGSEFGKGTKDKPHNY